MSRHLRSRRHLAVAVGASLFALWSSAPPAEAATQRTTRYFTISAGRATPSSSARFLRAGFGVAPVVTLAGYTPGDQSLQWTMAPNREWPASQTVSGGFGWPWAFEPGRFPLQIPEAKFVNRARGTCLTLRFPGNGGRVTAAPCFRAGVGLADQIWSGDPVIGTRDYRYFWQRKGGLQRCLDVTDFRDAIGTPLQGWACQPPNDRGTAKNSPWNQRFQLALVAQSTCEIVAPSRICGLAVSPP